MDFDRGRLLVGVVPQAGFLGDVGHFKVEHIVLVFVAADGEIRSSVEGAVLCGEIVIDHTVDAIVHDRSFIAKGEDHRIGVDVLEFRFGVEEHIDVIAGLKSGYGEFAALFFTFLALFDFDELRGVDVDGAAVGLYEAHAHSAAVFRVAVPVSSLLVGAEIEFRILFKGGFVIYVYEHACQMRPLHLGFA